MQNVTKFRKLRKVKNLKYILISFNRPKLALTDFYQNWRNFLDRTGLNNSSSVQNLQNTLLKALNLNIMIEHQQKNIETDPKLRFLDFLTRLQGMLNSLLIGSFVFNISCWSCSARVRWRLSLISNQELFCEHMNLERIWPLSWRKFVIKNDFRTSGIELRTQSKTDSNAITLRGTQSRSADQCSKSACNKFSQWKDTSSWWKCRYDGWRVKTQRIL